jgi:murein L,D-transpeptidase YcbB/YkuD
MIFLFPNPFHIYLHDTPVKSLFDENERAFSHGCIRLQNPIKLARYLLKDNPRWSAEKIDTILASNKNVKVVLLKKKPVYIVYFTTWVDNVGQLHFRKDLYGLDAALLLAMK